MLYSIDPTTLIKNNAETTNTHDILTYDKFVKLTFKDSIIALRVISNRPFQHYIHCC